MGNLKEDFKDELGHLVNDVAMEIIMGCDRFDRSDLRGMIKVLGVDSSEVKKLVNENIRSNYPATSWTEEFLAEQLTHWFDDDKVTYHSTCAHCGVGHDIEMTLDQFNRIELGEESIQIILPKHSASDRELIISSTCGSCWDEIFWEPEDINDEDEY